MKNNKDPKVLLKSLTSEKIVHVQDPFVLIYTSKLAYLTVS